MNITPYKSQHYAVSYVITFDCECLSGKCDCLHRFRV